MMITTFLPYSRSLASRLLRIATLTLAEYERATLAALHFGDLKGCDPAGLSQQRIGPGGIPRAVFEACYGNESKGAIGNQRNRSGAASRPEVSMGWAGAVHSLRSMCGETGALRSAMLGALGLALAMPALAADSTPYAMGGITREFAPKVREADRSGKLFRIGGHCQSACTMFLAVRNVCIEPSARLLFHAAKTPRGTQDMINSYNSKLRAYLVANKVMESPAFHTISGSDMIARFGYRRCP